MMNQALPLFILLSSMLASGTTYKKLSFSDFKGHGVAPAETVTEIDLIDIEDNGRFSFKVDLVFNERESYINLRTPEVLQHEQGHYDISVTYANNIRKTLVQFQGCRILTKKVVDAYYDSMIERWRAEQQQYDTETSHCTNKEQQDRWNGIIMTELNESK